MGPAAGRADRRRDLLRAGPVKPRAEPDTGVASVPGGAVTEKLHQFARGGRGMTLVEAVIVVLLLGVVLLVLAGAAGWTRQRAKDQLAWRMLAVLDQALRDYYQAERDYPPGQVDRRAEQAAAALLGHAKSGGDLVALPQTLRGGGDKPSSKRQDPWLAHRLSCETTIVECV